MTESNINGWAGAAFKDLAIWVFTGVSGFLGFTVWGLSGTMRELSVEIKYLAAQNADYEDDMESVRRQISSIRDEQLNRTESVYSLAEIKGRVDAAEVRIQAAERDLNSRTNIRWNKPDMDKFVNERMLPLERRVERLEASQ